MEKQQKKTQKKSISYALKAIVNHLKTVKEEGLLDKTDEEKVVEVLDKVVSKYYKNSFKL